MAVLLADRTVTVTKYQHLFPLDSMGTPTRSTTTSTHGPYRAAAAEQPDGTWRLRLDPAAWRIRPADEITDGTRVWVVTAAANVAVPGHPDVDHVTITATLDPPDVA